jgi:hypothetical protein
VIGGRNKLDDLNDNLSWLRGGRRIIGKLDLSLQLNTTVFLGFYKGEEYVKERIQDLEGQTSQDFYLVIVENCTPGFDPGTINELLEFSKKFTGRYMIVQNPINLGGLGSFQLNIDLLPTAWITFFHQDDKYLANHVASHLQAISTASESLSSVSTDLGSLNSEGKKVPVPPRANWFIDNSSKQATFLANVAEQVVPFASLSMRKARFEVDQAPMHTVAFSDSEQTLKSLMRGDHQFIKKETVLYRENPISESHTQGARVRTFSATIGLLRVFASDLFIDYARKISSDDRGPFVAKLEDAIRRRIQDLAFADLVWTMSLEQLNLAWGYEEPNSTSATRDVFSILGESYTPDILNGVLSKLDTARHYKKKITDATPPSSLETADNLTYAEPSVKKPKWTLLSLLYQVVGRLPYFIRRRIFKLYNSITLRSQPKPKGTL